MRIINATTIGKLIQAHTEGDEEKFLEYANFIKEAYKKAGDERSAKTIEKSIDNSRKNESQIYLDNSQNQCVYNIMLTDSDIELVKEYNAHHSSVGLFFDPLYIDVLKEYVSLLDGNIYNTQQISNETFIKNVMEKNRGKSGMQLLFFNRYPVNTIQVGISKVCEVLPVYKEMFKEHKEKEDKYGLVSF